MLPTSYRLRIPLSLVAASVITVAAFSSLMLLQTYENIQEDQRRFGERLLHVLAPSLSTALRHDDVWSAYALLRNPDEPAARENGHFLILLDDAGRVFASDRPSVFRVGDRPPADLQGVTDASTQDGGPVLTQVLRAGSRTVLSADLVSDKVQVGTLLVGFPDDVFWQRFIEIARGGTYAVTGMLAVLLPLGWYWGNRMVAPLRQLEKSMSRVGRDPPDKVTCPHYTGEDEISRLGDSFRAMLAELRNKQDLERQAIAQERLAAIGRLTAGVAHEINNPLAGVLLALDTYRKTAGPRDREGQRSLKLVERGLQQIRDTVSALLVECRLEPRNLTPADVDDLRVLVGADEAAQKRRIDWCCGLAGEVPVPATPVRQIILNLALNAVQAARENCLVRIEIKGRERWLRISVGDEGSPVDESVRDLLFEPFETRRTGGTGLGLWVTYETVRQLGGTLTVVARDDWTEFVARIPYLDRDEPPVAAVGS